MAVIKPTVAGWLANRSFSAALVYFHAVLAHIKGDVGHVHKIVGKILFDDVALVTTANNEVVDAVVGVGLEDVPQNGLAADFDHGFGASRGFFGDAGAKTTGENDCFHFYSTLTLIE